MKKIIFRGHNSFIGKNCINFFKNNYKIRKYSKNLKISKKENAYFLHLSGMTSVSKSFQNPYLTLMTNIRLMIESLEFCKKKNIKFIFFSTAYQKDNGKFASPYSFSKNICEEICKFYSENFKMDICVVRLSNIYGKYQTKQLVPDILRKLKTNKRIDVINYNLYRDFLYIKDLIFAIQKILNKFPKSINIYNISQNKNLKIIDFIMIIKKLVGSNSIIIKKKNKNALSKFRNVKINCKNFKKNFGWEPKFTFKEGIKDLLLK